MSVEKSLHVISLDVPHPPDYGGVIDIFYKLKALKAVGVHINLHCFFKSRKPASALLQFCDSVHYYMRSGSFDRFMGPLPYIVQSRSSEELHRRLLHDDAPVLMEGLHTTALLSDPAFFNRRCFVRTHNVEHDYYRGLSQVEPNLLRRWYLRMESRRLQRYEPVLEKATAIAAISPQDTDYFGIKYGRAFYLPAFHPFDKVETDPVTEDYALYHGNLSVGENNEAALFLVNKVFAKLPHRLVIAGSRPSAALRSAVSRANNVKLLDKLSPDEIHRLISRARINVLPTFQSTGIKLKLLAALFQGKTCIVNGPMVDNTGLETLCIVRNDADGFSEAVNREFTSPSWNMEALEQRKRLLEAMFSNTANARTLAARIFA